jgi:cation-transporting P-type ATPase E
VGKDSYARQLTAEARQFTRVRSELIEGINRILRYVTWAIPPAAALLLFSQFQAGVDWREALTGTVAGLVGMVPQGLMLLTSIAFAVAAVTLARRQVLVQELPAVEGLARVDVVCCDKTGTLTNGTIAFDHIVRLSEAAPAEQALTALAADENRNATLSALAATFSGRSDWVQTGSVPFSSARKWSAASFAGHGSWVLGAPEMVLEGSEPDVLAQATALADTGLRVLVLAWSDTAVEGERLPTDLQAVALVVFAEQVRQDAPAALAYFAHQGVAVKVLSGDNPHTVAMVGDGVNDALALKLADTGVAMGSGAPATRAVAQLVLLDGRFSSLPGVVAEGRRVTANIERVANLFITKTVWATLLAVAAGITLVPYLFLPRHLSIIDTFSIGVPAFFLALAPNLRRYVPGFVGRVLRFTIPAGIAVAIPTFAAFWLARAHDLPLTQQRTAATIVTMMVGLGVLVILALPLTWRRGLLVALMIAGFVLLFPFEAVRRFAALDVPSATLLPTLLIGVGGLVLLAGAWAMAAPHLRYARPA